MPIQSCEKDGSPGYRYGTSGACYTYTPGNEASKKAAYKKAARQAAAIHISQGGDLISFKDDFTKNNQNPNIDIEELLKDFGKSEEDRLLILGLNYIKECKKKGLK